MHISNLVSAVIVASLLIGNVACACEKVDTAITSAAHHQHDAHHEHHASDQRHQAPCDHQNCDSCASLESGCPSSAYDAICSDRETRLNVAQKNDGLDSPDLDHVPTDTGQPRASPSMVVLRVSYESPPFLLADTPIQRKDQLTE